MNTREFAELVGGRLRNLSGNKEIEGYSTDSRTIKDNSLFIPIIGKRVNGHKFFTKELAKRGIVSLWDEDRPLEDDLPVIEVDDTLKALYRGAKEKLKSTHTKVIGISGSNGKTSVKDFLSSILAVKYIIHSNKGNLNTDIGLSLTILEMPLNAEYAVLEMGIDHFGEMKLLTNIAPPDHFILTNVGEAHLDDLKTPEGIAMAKTEFLDNFKGGYILYNGEDELFRKALKIRRASDKGTLKSYGIRDEDDFILELKEKDGSSFRLKKPPTIDFKINAIGVHQALNAASSVAMGLLLGLDEEEINEGLIKAKLSDYRTELIKKNKAHYLNDAYKSNPSSLRAGLRSFYEIEGYKKKIAVIGDMLGIGIDAPKYHYDIGQEIDCEEIDLLYLMGEYAKELYRGAKENFGERVRYFTNRTEMIEAIKSEITDNTLIFLKASNSEKFYELPEEIEG